MNTQYLPASETLSALVDGELSLGAYLSELDAPLEAGHSHSDWNAYQVIGQVLKGAIAPGEAGGADVAFLQRLNTRLLNEKMTPAASRGAPVVSIVTLPTSRHLAANDGQYRWKLLAGFATLGAVVAVTWSLLGGAGGFGESGGPQLARNLITNPLPDQVLVASPIGPMVRDARLEELMAAHKQLGGTSLQAPSGFLRNAGFENSPNSQR